MADPNTETYRRQRGSIGLVLAAIWIVGWWIKLAAAAHAAAESCTGGNLFQDIGASICKGNANGGMVGGIILAILTSPLAFVVSHYVAKHLVAEQVAAEERARRDQEQQRRTAYDAEIKEMGGRAERETATAQAANDRHEVITRLGVVDDHLILIDGEQDPERVKRITVNLTQALREIHAKFTIAALAEMHAADAGLRQHVERTLEEMERVGLGGSRQHKDLAALFRVKLASADMPLVDGSAA